MGTMTQDAFGQLLDTLYYGALDKRDQGTKFERLVRSYLLADRAYSFSNVLLWFSSSGQGYGRRGGFGVEGPVAEHGVEHIGSSSGQRDHSLVVAFTLGPFSIVIGP